MDADMVRQSMANGVEPTVTTEQLGAALSRSGQPPAEVLEIVQKHLRRLRHQEQTLESLRDGLTGFFNACGGQCRHIGAFISDLAPPPARGEPLPPGLIQVCGDSCD